MKEEENKNFDHIIETIEKAKQDRTKLLPLIEENMRVKLFYMEGDEFDQGRRNLLNYGHCLGHALETVTDYYVPHGIAVTVGMIFANAVSLKRGWMSEAFFDHLNEKLFAPNIPLVLENSHFDRERLLQAMKNDKKRIGKALTAIVPDSSFVMQKMDDITEDEFDSALNMTRNFLVGRTI
jgi:3-dehydroquinate synthase